MKLKRTSKEEAGISLQKIFWHIQTCGGGYMWSSKFFTLKEREKERVLGYPPYGWRFKAIHDSYKYCAPENAPSRARPDHPRLLEAELRRKVDGRERKKERERERRRKKGWERVAEREVPFTPLPGLYADTVTTLWV